MTRRQMMTIGINEGAPFQKIECGDHPIALRAPTDASPERELASYTGIVDNDVQCGNYHCIIGDCTCRQFSGQPHSPSMCRCGHEYAYHATGDMPKRRY